MSLSTFMTKMMAKKGAGVKERFNQATMNPRKEQEDILFRMIEKTKNTAFGKDFGFDSIKTVQDFQERIPIMDYDTYAPYVERMKNGENNVLTTDEIVHFNTTSGTLGAPKSIPVTEAHVKVFSEFHGSYINYIMSEVVGYEWTKHKGFSLAEGTYKILPTGVSLGCASSLMAARIGKMIPFMNLDLSAGLYSSPIEARQPEGGTCTRYLHVRFALTDPELSYMTATFSSYIYEIMRYMEDHWEMFVNDIRTGTIDDSIELPRSVRESLKAKIKPMPERAAQLEKIFKEGFETETPIMKKIWHNMTFIMTVGGAGFSTYTEKLKERYCGNDMQFLFLGITASEGFFSLPVRLNDTTGALVPNGVFMEFRPVDDDNAKPLLIDELQLGGEYELIITNLAGLFRYCMKDVVRVTGFYNKTPMVEFVSRKGNAINIFNEKTSESALQKTAVMTAKTLGLDMYDYVFCPINDGTSCRYDMLLELRNTETVPDLNELARTAEKILGEANPSFGAKIASGVFDPLQAKILQKETFLLYRDMQIYKGRPAAQLKPIHVLTPVTQGFFYGLVSEE